MRVRAAQPRAHPRRYDEAAAAKRQPWLAVSLDLGVARAKMPGEGRVTVWRPHGVILARVRTV